MERIGGANEVGAAIELGRDGRSRYHTNFFAASAKLDAWIAHGELFVDGCKGATLFLRKDRELWHLYFCATRLDVLQRSIEDLAIARTEPMVIDLVGKCAELEELASVIERASFRPYKRLIRMALDRTRCPVGSRSVTSIGEARHEDSERIVNLLLSTFDRRAEQIPQTYEISAAVDARQILLARRSDAPTGLLFSETFGLTSTIRYWLVVPEYRARGLGSDLMRQYFANHPDVRRFLLWVISDNDDAVGKYAHYGFDPDGLIDQVFVNHIGNS